MKRRPGLITMDATPPNIEPSLYLNAADSSGGAQHTLRSAGDTAPVIATSQVWVEAWHGAFYGGGLGLLLGGYVLFFPQWVTVSPTWYMQAHWYTVIAITMLAGMGLMGLGGAILGAHVIQPRWYQLARIRTQRKG